MTLHPQPIAGDTGVSGRTHDQEQGVEARVGDQGNVTEEERRPHQVGEVNSLVIHCA